MKPQTRSGASSGNVDTIKERPPTGAPTPEPQWAGGGSVLDRRAGIDRREIAARLDKQGVASGEPDTGLERRRGPGRRRTDFMKSAEEGELTSEQFLFVMAIKGLTGAPLTYSYQGTAWTAALRAG